MMARLAIIDSHNLVVNVVLGDISFEPGGGLHSRQSDDAQIGDRWKSGSEYTRPIEAVADQPLTILSDRQFYMQLVAANYITQGDALTLMQGLIPAPLSAVLERLPAEMQFGAKMALLGNYFDIDSPFIAAAAPMFDPQLADRAKLEAFWRAAALL